MTLGLLFAYSRTIKITANHFGIVYCYKKTHLIVLFNVLVKIFNLPIYLN